MFVPQCTSAVVSLWQGFASGCLHAGGGGDAAALIVNSDYTTISTI